MKIIKGYAKNLHRLETSIVERYIIEKTIEFCSAYIEKTKSVSQVSAWQKSGGKSSWRLHVITPSLEELNQTYLYILNNTNEVVPYIIHHEALVKESNLKMTKNMVLKEHKKTYLNWFKDIIFGDDNASEMLRKLVDKHQIY